MLFRSTSWTDDEDFSLLFDSLLPLHKIFKARKQRVCIFITGKGANRSRYEAEYAELKAIPGLLQTLRVSFLWLDFVDYPKFLQCVDWGLCLHQSSSGLDLPMKVVDMFGFAELPVIARRFFAIDELVVEEGEGKNGFLFDTKEDLQTLLAKASLVPEADYLLLKRNVRVFGGKDWGREWAEKVKPLI